MNVNHTACCAIGMLSGVSNETSVSSLIKTLQELKKESEKNWAHTPPIGGEKAILCVTTPTEKKLEKNLENLGFRILADGLNRRTGYPEGTLKLWMINW